jgi:ArsR family transcriptional regulator
MKDNGILEAKRDGARVCYSLKDEMLVELVRVLRIEDCTASVAAETARSR